MKSSEGVLGRTFIIRLENGDIVPDCIESFAREKKIKVGEVLLIGGIGSGQVVVGPRFSDEIPPEPILVPVDGVHEVAGVGLIAPDAEGQPILHIHAAMGRAGKTTTGCLRPGVKTWVVAEVIIHEILKTEAVRLPDEETGFMLLQV
ncbi:PPC domain-containing DNA-binding protein [Chloroflexota bacterium]